ncbi:hypothetical protein GM31_20030, partial [Trabulsiella odontotermitis]
ASLGRRLMEKATVATPQIAAMAMRETLENPLLRQNIGTDLTRWQQRIAQHPEFTADRRYVGGLSPSLLDALPGHGVKPASATIALSGQTVADAAGDDAAGDDAPDWTRLPDLLYSPDVVLWDAATGLLHYITQGDTSYTASVLVKDGQPVIADLNPLDSSQRAMLTGLPVLSGGWK